MSPTRREGKFQFRITEEERRMLEDLAEQDGLSASDKLRQMIRRDHAAAFGEKTPKKKRE